MSSRLLDHLMGLGCIRRIGTFHIGRRRAPAGSIRRTGIVSIFRVAVLEKINQKDKNLLRNCHFIHFPLKEKRKEITKCCHQRQQVGKARRDRFPLSVRLGR